MTIDDLTLDTAQSIDIKADIGDVFRSVVHRLGEGSTNAQGESMQMTLEQWPGGRWFRDRGNGVGHLWGHVQVIKAPVLLELSGPMFMSYPALNHIEVKLEQRPGGTHVDTPAPRPRLHRSGASAECDYGLEAHSGGHRPGLLEALPRRSRPKLPPTTWTVCGRRLSDSTRRAILDLLRQGPRTTTEIVGGFSAPEPLWRDEAYRSAPRGRPGSHARGAPAAD